MPSKNHRGSTTPGRIFPTRLPERYHTGATCAGVGVNAQDCKTSSVQLRSESDVAPKLVRTCGTFVRFKLNFRTGRKRFMSRKAQFTQDAEMRANFLTIPWTLLVSCVNTPIDHNVLHSLHLPVARCSASCMNGPSSDAEQVYTATQPPQWTCSLVTCNDPSYAGLRGLTTSKTLG